MVVATVFACGSPATAPRSPEITLGDATFAAPPGRHVEQHADRVTLTDPDHAIRVTIVPNAGADAATAVAAAWRLVEPGFALAPRAPEEVPDSDDDDWDAVTTIDYQPPTSQQRTVVARWRRSGAHRFVVLVDGDRVAVDRRATDISVLEGTRRYRFTRTTTATTPTTAAALSPV